MGGKWVLASGVCTCANTDGNGIDRGETKWRGLDRKPHLGNCACVINSRGAAPEFCLSGSPSTTGASVLITPPRTMTWFHGRCPHWPRSACAQRQLDGRCTEI